jgi:flagellar biosynthesis protein FliQ
MDQVTVMEVGREGLFVVLKTAGPIMLSGLAIGLTIALFQALTSIQEMTLTFVPKIVVIFLAIIVFLPYMMSTVVDFGTLLYGRIAGIG